MIKRIRFIVEFKRDAVIQVLSVAICGQRGG